MTITQTAPPDNNPPKRKSLVQRPVLVISIYSWIVPILILLVFLLGIVLGYFLHPSATAPIGQSDSPQNPTDAALSQTQRQKIMETLKQQTQHFQGSASAPVVMFEFGDFQ